MYPLFLFVFLLLERATNPQNENVDTAAVEAFCSLVNKENEGAHIAVRLIANKIHALNEKEALQALGVNIPLFIQKAAFFK